MEKYNSPINIFRQLNMSTEEYAIYKRDMREYNFLKNIPLKGITIRKAIYPIVAFFVKLFRWSNKHTLKIINDNRTKTNKPCILAVTHVGKFDLERVFEICNTSCWIFNSDPETVYRNFDGFSLNASGVVHIDTNSKSDRKIALETAIKLLNSGGNLMFYPEGIWNVEPSVPVLPLYKGIVEIAFRSNADIIPIALEQYENHFEVNIGRNITIEDLHNISFSNNENIRTQEILDYLRNVLATLKWEIFERHTESRANITENVEIIQQRRIKEKLCDWVDKSGNPYYNETILKERQFKPKGRVEYSDAFAHLDNITANRNTAFLFNKRLK